MPSPTYSPLIALRWPAGVLSTGWTYMWRTTPMHRRELDGRWEDDRPPEVPDDVERDGIQELRHGAGPLLHRRYSARILEPRMDAQRLMACLSEDPNRVAPGGLARFVKQRGEDARMRVGDEWIVRMPGPWNGPVRVVEVTSTSFRFATLDRHLEAGQIEWHAGDDDGDLRFGIESWARSGDRLSDLMHNRLRMAKEVQLHMWTSVIERVVRLAGSRMAEGLDIETRRVAEGDLPPDART